MESDTVLTASILMLMQCNEMKEYARTRAKGALEFQVLYQNIIAKK